MSPKVSNPKPLPIITWPLIITWKSSPLSTRLTLPTQISMRLNIGELFEKIVKFIPPPEGDPEAPLKALVFDMKYDIYKGIIIYVRIFEGAVKPGVRIDFMNVDKDFDVQEVGIFA